MSYKQDMRFFKEQQGKRKTFLSQMIKITVLALAAAILVTGVTAGITAMLGGFRARAEREDEDTSGGGVRFTGPKGDTVTLMIGDTPTYRKYVTCSDKNAKITIDNKGVDTSKAGTYTVRYTATTSSGKQTSYTLTLIISADPTYTVERLMSMIEKKAQALGITETMSKTEQVKRIYSYVRNPEVTGDKARIYFSDESNALSQKTQSGIRTGWENDWVEEAIRTLELIDSGKGKGDCYSYYSVSKAFFEYFEIENVGIQRKSGSGMAGTHFWQAVNVGTKSAPKWYYYDSTRLAGKFSDGTSYSCLITEEKLQSYKTSKGEIGFYAFDRSQYKNFPTIETTPLS